MRRFSTFPTRSGALLRHLGCAAVGAATLALPWSAHGQLTVDGALAMARRSSPVVRAASEAVAVARGHERHAGVLTNPTLSYGREQTNRGTQGNAQDIVQVEQPFEIGGQRESRKAAAVARRAAAEAREASTLADLDLGVVRAFIAAIAADRRAALAGEAMATLAEAQRVNDERLRAGDVSGYTARRLRLEVARGAAIRASLEGERRTVRATLASLLGLGAAAGDSLMLMPGFPTLPLGLPAVDSLRLLLSLAERDRPDLREAWLAAAAADADARLAQRERRPTPTLYAGYKGERVADSVRGSLGGFRGFVAGVSMPLPIFDRRQGVIAGADAEARRQHAEVGVRRQRVAEEVSEAAASLRAAEQQLVVLSPFLGEEARLALRAVQASYTEGDITLVEWLDAMRAYQDAEAAHVTMQAHVALGRAALARAIGLPLMSAAPTPSSR